MPVLERARVSFLREWDEEAGVSGFPPAGAARMIWTKTAGLEWRRDPVFEEANAVPELRAGFGWRETGWQVVCRDVSPESGAQVGTAVVAAYPGMEPYLWEATVVGVESGGRLVRLHFADGDEATVAWSECRTLPSGPSSEEGAVVEPHSPVIAPIATYTHNDRRGFLRYMRGTLLGVGRGADDGNLAIHSSLDDQPDVCARTAEVEAKRNSFLAIAMRACPNESWVRQALSDGGVPGPSHSGNNAAPAASTPSQQLVAEGPGPIAETLFEEASKDLSLEEHFPHHLLCPISMSAMRDPVVCADGHTYDREQIERWIACCHRDGEPTRSPVTNELLGCELLFPNLLVRAEVNEALEAIKAMAGTGAASGACSEPSAPPLPEDLPRSIAEVATQTLQPGAVVGAPPRMPPLLTRQASATLLGPRQSSAPSGSLEQRVDEAAAIFAAAVDDVSALLRSSDSSTAICGGDSQ